MKLYSVSAIWKPYRNRYNRCITALIIAESEGEAVAKFKKCVTYPEGAIIHSAVWEGGIYTLRVKRLSW